MSEIRILQKLKQVRKAFVETQLGSGHETFSFKPKSDVRIPKETTAGNEYQRREISAKIKAEDEVLSHSTHAQVFFPHSNWISEISKE